MRALRVQREVNHQDSVLLHDPDQKNNSDQGNDGQLGAAEQQRQQRSHAG